MREENRNASESASKHSGKILGWWLVPIVFLGSVFSAFWGIRHIENQVLAAAPGILQDAGIDIKGLSFKADYRNITVAGQLPEGVTSTQVQTILQQNHGPASEDIRHATVVAKKWLKPELQNELVSGSSAERVASDVEADDLAVELPDRAHSEMNRLKDTDDTGGSDVEADVQEDVEQELLAGEELERQVTILLADRELTLRGSGLTEAEIDRLLRSASSSVGLKNVKLQLLIGQVQELQEQQGQTEAGSGSAVKATKRSEQTQVDALASVLETLGGYATSASITLENKFISCLLYTSPSPRDATLSRMPSSA